jgi:hypothetical protein
MYGRYYLRTVHFLSHYRETHRSTLVGTAIDLALVTVWNGFRAARRGASGEHQRFLLVRNLHARGLESFHSGGRVAYEPDCSRRPPDFVSLLPQQEQHKHINPTGETQTSIPDLDVLAHEDEEGSLASRANAVK